MMNNIILSNDNNAADNQFTYSDLRKRYAELATGLRKTLRCEQGLIIGDSESAIGLYITMLAALELECAFCFASEWQALTTEQRNEISQCHIGVVKVKLLSVNNMSDLYIEQTQTNNIDNRTAVITCGGVYFFTSGSTGTPKIIFHDVKTLRQMVETFTLLYSGGVHYTTTPLTGLGSIQFLMLALHLESPYIIGGSLEKAIAQLSSSDIQAVIFTYPSLLINYVLSSDDHSSMPLLGEINLGGEPILETDTLTLSKIFGCEVRWAYGAAEVGPLAEGIGFQNGQAVYQPIENSKKSYIQLQVRDSEGLDIIATVNTFNSAYVANNKLSYFGENYHTGDVASVVSSNQFFVQDRGYKNIGDSQLIDRLNTQLNKLGKKYDTAFFRIVAIESDHQTTLRVICFARESELYSDIVADLHCSIDSEALDVKCYSAPRLLRNGKLDLQYYKTRFSVLEALESTE